MRDLHEAGDGGWLCIYPDPTERIALGEVGQHGDGEDLAILTFGNGCYLARQAQRTLAAAKIDARVIDIRWLLPLPEAAIVAAIDGCRHVLIVDETRRTGGLAEGLMALLFENISVPHARLTAEDSFIATGPAYGATLPSASDIVAAARSLVGGEA
jgi:2-oxoisovalerate dehydrogenase E1 component